MTYKHLIQFIKENEAKFPATQIAKFKSNKSTKLIFLVGEDASNTASFLSSVMSINLYNVPLAALTVEASRVLFDLPDHRIRTGLIKAKLVHDLKIHSLSPVIITNTGNRRYKLHHNVKYQVNEI